MRTPIGRKQRRQIAAAIRTGMQAFDDRELIGLFMPTLIEAARAIPKPSTPEQQEAFERWKAALPDMQRKCLDLRASGMTYHQIAAELGISKESALAALTEIYADRGSLRSN